MKRRNAMKILLLMLLPMLVFGANPKWIDKVPDSILVLTDCTEDTSQTITYGTWLRTSGELIEYDYDGYDGNRNIKLTSINAVTTGARTRLNPLVDVSNYTLINIKYKMDDASRNNSSFPGTYDIRVLLMTNTLNYVQYYVTTRNRIYTKDNWYNISLRLDQPNSTTGTYNNTDVNYVQINVSSASGKTVIATIGGVSITNTPLKTGYFNISLDAAENTMLSLAYPIFERYNVKPTLYHIPARVGAYWAGTNMDWGKVDSLYNSGWEIGSMGWDHSDFDTLTPEQIYDNIKQGHDTLQAHGYRHRRLFAVNFGDKNRKIDTAATKFTDIRRGVGGAIDIPAIGADGVFLPMGTAKYVTQGGIIQMDTAVSGRWSTIKTAIDSAVSRKIITGVIIHKFRTSAGTVGNAVMDTAALDSMLFYLDSLKTEGLIDFGGMGGLFTFAPDSCIVPKSRAFDYGELEIIDSISTDADSMRIVLYKQDGTTWDSIAGTTMRVRGSICTLNVSGLPVGTHTLREWGVANSGHIDSGLAVYTLSNRAVDAGVTVTTSRYQPSNIHWVWMNTDAAVVAAADSFAVDLSKRLYGPYEIVKKPSGRNVGVFPAGFQIYADAPLGADDSLFGSYQLLPSVNGVVPTFADTVTTGWVTACTTSTAGGVNKYIDLSSKAGSFIVWCWMSRSASAVGLYGNAGLGFKESASYVRDID